jgi:hypothetical protein
VTAVIAMLGTAPAFGQCVQWQGDDTGCFPPSKAKARCEERIAGFVGTKLVKGIIRCHQRYIDDRFANGNAATFDEAACKAAAVSKFTHKSNRSNCFCVNLDGISQLAQTVLDTNNNLAYCDPAGPLIGGLDSGNVPSTRGILNCETKFGRKIVALIKSFVNCHQLASRRFISQIPFDEENCENVAIAAFNLTDLTGCAGCEDKASIVALTFGELEAGNGLVFCESASGAFVEAAE